MSSSLNVIAKHLSLISNWHLYVFTATFVSQLFLKWIFTITTHSIKTVV